MKTQCIVRLIYKARRRSPNWLIAISAIVATLALSGTEAIPPLQPDYYPVCSTPQPISLQQPAGGIRVSERSTVVWNGRDFGVAYIDHNDYHLKFRRFYADGTPVAPAVTVSTLISDYTTWHDPPGLVWNGNGYGVAWGAHSCLCYNEPVRIYFTRLNADGVPLGAEVRVSFVNDSTPTHSWMPALAWGGNSYAVVWTDSRPSTYGIHATLLGADGTISGGGALHDILISNPSAGGAEPSIVWASPYDHFYVVWPGGYQINGIELYPNGQRGYSPHVITTSTGEARDPALVDTGNGMGVVWHDSRDGNFEIYFARISALFGDVIGTPVRLTNDSAASFWPRLVWTGAEFGVFWQDNRYGSYYLYDIFFQRVNFNGQALGPNTQLTFSGGTSAPDAAFGRNGFLMTSIPSYQGGANYVMAVGCVSDTTPPTCPGGFTAYNISGTGLTIGWLPSGDQETDLAYYNVYRNAQLIGRTGNGYYSDSGLTPNTAYAYAVQPANAAQLQNYSCQTQITVTTNGSLNVVASKEANGVRLRWNNSGATQYNVSRGLSPQAMSRIDQTFGLNSMDEQDMSNDQAYFYSIDE